MISIRLDGVTKSFSKDGLVLSALSLSVEPGERLALVGPSGAGKTTLLRLVAGFEKVDAGKIFLGEREVTNLPPEDRDLGFVFQNHALYPHLTVAENLGFPLRLRNVSKAEISAKVEASAKLLQLEHLLQRRPGELSGGEAQRVALGRALIRKPAALLMDEPLSSLPPDLRLRLRHELIKLHEADRRPILYVTHDHEEALALGERVAVMDHGVLQQIGTPREIYERPANRFVAGFIGKPSMNFVTVNGTLRGVRPEHLEICDAKDAWFIARVESVQYGGSYSDILAKYDHGEVIVRKFDKGAVVAGDPLPLCASAEHVHEFDNEGRRLKR